MKFKSIKTKILLWYGTITFAVLYLVGFVFYFLIELSTLDLIEHELNVQAKYLQTHIIPKLKSNEMISDSDVEMGLEVYVFKNRKLIHHTQTSTLKNPEYYLDVTKFRLFEEGENVYDELFYQSRFENMIVLVEHDEELFDALSRYIVGDTIVLLYKKNIHNSAEEVEHISQIVFIALVVILLFLASKLIDKLLVPIIDITQTTKQISVDNFSHNITSYQSDNEIGHLVASFNAMIERLREEIERMQHFNSNVSHELKTPLTIIRTEIELALDRPRQEGYYQNALQNIDIGAQQLQRVVESLLLLTKYSAKTIQESFDEVRLEDILVQTINQYHLLSEKKSIMIHLQKVEPLILHSNSRLIQIIFANIIDNALKYSPTQSTITISLFKQDNQVCFVVQDEGIGISKKHLSQLTQRFYRAEFINRDTMEGFGLGLNIVKTSLALLQGTIEIKSVEGEGTRVVIMLSEAKSPDR